MDYSLWAVKFGGFFIKMQINCKNVIKLFYLCTDNISKTLNASAPFGVLFLTKTLLFINKYLSLPWKSIELCATLRTLQNI